MKRPYPPRLDYVVLDGPGVLATRGGAKTVLRVVMRQQPVDRNGMIYWRSNRYDNGAGGNFLRADEASARRLMRRACPYGDVGCRLWVREKWGAHTLDHSDPPQRIVFAADGANYDCGDAFDGRPPKRGPVELDSPAWRVPRWRSPMHMPRWASRLTLEVTGVGAERLQDITEASAKAEGVTLGKQRGTINGAPGDLYPFTYRTAFGWRWNATHEERTLWRQNPWVWVISYKAVKE